MHQTELILLVLLLGPATAGTVVGVARRRRLMSRSFSVAYLVGAVYLAIGVALAIFISVTWEDDYKGYSLLPFLAGLILAPVGALVVAGLMWVLGPPSSAWPDRGPHDAA